MGLHMMDGKLLVCANGTEFRNSCCGDEPEGPFCLYVQNHNLDADEGGKWGYCIPPMLVYKRSTSQQVNLWSAGYDQDKFPQWFTVPSSLEDANNTWIITSGPGTCYWIRWQEPEGQVCKVEIFYEPVDDECGDCSFRLGTGASPGNYWWEEKSRNVSEVSTDEIETDPPGWYGECPELRFVWYSECLEPDRSHCDEEIDPPEENPCDVYEEKYTPEGSEEEYYIHFDIRDPNQTFEIPPSAAATLDQDCVDNHLAGNPTAATYTAEYRFEDELDNYVVDLELWVGEIYYTGAGVFSGEVDHFKWDVWGKDDVTATRNCSWIKTIYEPDIFGPECVYHEDSNVYIEEERNKTLYSSPWFGADGSWRKANGFVRWRTSYVGCFDFHHEYASEYIFSDSPCGGYDSETRDIDAALGGWGFYYVTTNKSKLIVN